MPDRQPPETPRSPSSPPPPAGSGTLVLSGARLADGAEVDVRVTAGRIEAVGRAGSLVDRTARAAGCHLDLRGYLLLPAPAEPHAHHDNALTADTDGPPSSAPREVQRRTTEAALLQLGHGTTAIRTHVRIDDHTAPRTLQAVLGARRELRGLTDLGVVAVPRLLTGVAGARTLALLRDAVRMGADVLGGCPDLDPDPAGYAEAVLSLAAEHGCAVDLHTDAADPARLTRLAAMARGLRPGVTLGPCGGLARMPPAVAARVAEQLADSEVRVVTLPQGDCGYRTRPAPSTAFTAFTAPVRLLRAAGVHVAAGSGALRDTRNPVGRGDPLEAAYLLAARGEATPEEAYAAVSARARTVLGLPPVRVEAGFPAELLAVRGQTLPGVLSLGYSRVVVHRGRVVARTSAVREFCSPADTAEGAGLSLPRQAQG
ncbi:hydrolase [Streptomyces sp. JJ66]|uniref:hydrolase n=1 Tax=Streptomyces sp. JJ66 TaxID=2803843 RepID=UPI001C56E655|nr:hydrolase [Streptomyces sp. JJ66]MBW1602535.1 hydrolase [Streptomyces sp. JJ66]